MWLPGRMHVEERLNEGRRPLNKKKKDENETKTKKSNARERQHDTRPEDTISRHLWLINYGERTGTSTFALVYPLLDASRYHHVRAHYCMPVVQHSHSYSLAFDSVSNYGMATCKYPWSHTAVTPAIHEYYLMVYQTERICTALPAYRAPGKFCEPPIRRIQAPCIHAAPFFCCKQAVSDQLCQ